MTDGQPRVLVVFHTVEGQTTKIAERISDRLRAGGADVDQRTTDAQPDPAEYHGAVLGDSIHVSHHSRELIQYARHHAPSLADMPSALFQVSLTSIGQDDEHVAQAHRFVADLVRTTGWEPDLVGLFAGAVRYTHYGWAKRHLMREIAKKQGAATDMTSDHEYTDWDAVEAFADDVLALVRGRVDAP